MMRVRGDEPEASAVVDVDRDEGDAPVVVDAAEAGSSSGTRASLCRAVTVEGSAQPAVVAVADEAKETSSLPRHKQMTRASTERPEDSEDMDSDKEDRDRKSRFVLKKLKTGQIPFRRNGKPNCPFCGRVFPKDIESLIQHATGVGKGSAHKHKAASKAKHAAFGKFLRDYVKTSLIPLVGPAIGPHVLH
ncbi:hypothetical protein QYE76_034568 [Lolium multiflorum]|uniref:Zinc finger-XS domain-containing protein n=1 Tax=Lolium multiflorum TaxID=4521 RepID=A0AAD8VN73_LOLMU|nr:hypothetical protein QYE76_034568 [Lolium multiflorum]